MRTDKFIFLPRDFLKLLDVCIHSTGQERILICLRLCLLGIFIVVARAPQPVCKRVLDWYRFMAKDNLYKKDKDWRQYNNKKDLEVSSTAYFFIIYLQVVFFIFCFFIFISLIFREKSYPIILVCE